MYNDNIRKEVLYLRRVSLFTTQGAARRELVRKTWRLASYAEQTGTHTVYTHMAIHTSCNIILFTVAIPCTLLHPPGSLASFHFGQADRFGWFVVRVV